MPIRQTWIFKIHAAAEKLARRKADAYQSKYAAALAQAQERIHRLSMEFKRTKHIHDGLTAGVQCPMCRQTITGADIAAG